MKNLKVIILAAGDGFRWRNYTGVPKHQVVVEGEILIERTAKQFLKYTNDVTIVATDDSSRVEGCSLYIPELNRKNKELDKFLSSKNLWSEHKTILVFGDVYFTDEAIDKIITNDTEWSFYLRKGQSQLTGKAYGEVFALSFESSFNDKMTKALDEVGPDTSSPGAWSVLIHLLKLNTTNDIFRTKSNYGYTIVDDWTDDFDYPEDFDLWNRNRKRYL